jgi:hypothetical protein
VENKKREKKDRKRIKTRGRSGWKRGRQTDFSRYTKEGTERMRHKREKKRDKVGGYLTLPQQYETFCRTTSITQQSPCYPAVS